MILWIHLLQVLGNISISNYYKGRLIDSMKYTLSHEYGHHETMWSNYGTYGPKRPNTLTTYEDTIGLYSEDLAAKSQEYVNERTFNLLDEISKNYPGLKNAMQIIKTSNDRYSSTWTPTYTSHLYYGFNPGDGSNPNPRWSQSNENIYETVLHFLTGVNGQPEVRLGNDDLLGSTPIEFKTQGVDSNGDRNTSNYLFNIDRSHFSPDNPLKSIDPTRLGHFLKLLINPEDLLYGYQISKWKMAGRGSGDPADETWLKENQIALPQLSSILYQRPTTEFSPILARFSAKESAKMYSLKSLIMRAFVVSSSDAKEVIDALDKIVKTLYDGLIKTYPNLFENVGSTKKMSDYKRAKIIYQQVLNDTKKQIGGSSTPLQMLEQKFGIYYDPETLPYIHPAPAGKTEDQLFDIYRTDKLITEGTVQLGQAKSGFCWLYRELCWVYDKSCESITI